MKVLLQWARLNPQDWIPIDLDVLLAAWETLPSRAEPGPGVLGGTNNALGWINNLMVQGVRFNGADHYAVERVTVGLEAGIRVTVWNDDPDDWPVGQRHARVWTFLPLASDSNLGGAINTRQTQVLYAEGERFLRIPPQNTTVLPWTDFIPPAVAITRHGVLLTDAKYAEHITAQTEWGWRHWVDHLPDSEVVTLPDGRRELKDQRPQGRYSPSEHTLTWFQRDTDLAQGWIIAVHEDSLLGTAGGGETESASVGVTQENVWIFATPVDEPKSSDWPNGVYRAQADCTAVSAGIVYGIHTFARLQADLSLSVSTFAPLNGDGDLNDFSGTGLKLSTKTENPVAGNANERYGLRYLAEGTAHGQSITFRFSADAWADGPWPDLLPLLLQRPEPTERSQSASVWMNF